MAHTKSGGSTRLGRDSASKRLGVKKFDGELVKPGNVLIKQRGTKWHPGKNTRISKDDTIYAIKEGIVKFEEKTKYSFVGKRKKVSVVNVIPAR